MPKISATHDNFDTIENSAETKASEVASTTREEARAILTAFPDILARDKASNLDVEDKSEGKNNVDNFADNFAAFKHEYVQAAVEEAMDEFCADMRKQLWHMHYDMIKAFQQQQLELKNSLREYAVNETLVEEVERLRAENAELKRTPFIVATSQNKSNPTETI